MDNEVLKRMLMEHRAGKSAISTSDSDRLTVELLAYCVGVVPDMPVKDVYTLIQEVIEC